MLRKIRNGAFALAAATAMIASGVQAQSTSVEHEVIFIQGSYFPVVTKAAPGDTIKFINKNRYYSHRISGYRGAWTTGKLDPNDEYILTVTDTTPLKFGGYYGRSYIRGQIDTSN